MVDGVQGETNISEMWKSHYNNIFNIVPNSNCHLMCEDLEASNTPFSSDMIVSADEIQNIIKQLANCKSPGPDGRTAEHFKYAGFNLPVLFALCTSTMLVHTVCCGSYIVKDKNKHITDKNNYRPICLSNVFTKILENILLSRIDNFICTKSNQFGFKQKHGTDMCVFVFKELVRYYISHGSNMFVTF